MTLNHSLPSLRMIQTSVCALAVVAMMSVPLRGHAEDSPSFGAKGAPTAGEELTAARDLYASAAYEDALALLNRLRGGLDNPQDQRTVAQYRAFCLLALGRTAEAAQAFEPIIAAEPAYQPAEGEVSPRVRAAFDDVRRRMLPVVIQQKYQEAKAAFDQKSFAAANAGFVLVAALLSDPMIGDAAKRPPLSDIRMLATGFGDLSAAAVAPPPAAAPPVAVAASALPAAPVAPPPPPRIYSSSDGNVVPPGTIRQEIPPFPFRPQIRLRGTVAVVINETGTVDSVSMIQPLNSGYDRAVVEAAKNWRYTPASLDGAPVRFRKAVQITVEPGR